MLILKHLSGPIDHKFKQIVSPDKGVHSAVVSHSSLSAKNKQDLERVQKRAVRVILQGKYKSYQKGLKTLNIKTLENRSEKLPKT